MKSLRFILFCLFIGTHFSLYSLFGQNNPEKPNFVLILADDLVYGDLGFQGSKQIPTPYVDRLAESWIVFSNGYVSSPVCSPSRAGLLTGKNQVSFGHGDNLSGVQPGFDPDYIGLPLTEETLADRIKSLGYVNGLVGKWHLGEEPHFYPTKRGFDEFWGFLGGGHDYFVAKPGGQGMECPIECTYKTPEPLTYITDDIGDECVDFIKRHKHQPFFLFASFNAPLRGQKTTVLEGGIRVPFIFKWPSIINAGKKIDDLILSLDICPTFIEASGGIISDRDKYRGVNIIPFLTGQNDKIPHESMEWKYTVGSAIRDGDWKLISLPDSDHIHREGWNRPGFRLGYGSDERFKGSFDEWPSGLGQLYSAGHLMVAGAAYYRATGKRNLLEIAIKMADCIYRELPPGKPFDYIDHPGLGLGLVKLYEVTGDEKYLKLAEHIVHNGNHARPVDFGNGENRKPIEEQRKAWGHAVCINYHYSGATDLCRYRGEPETRIALDSLWHSIVDRRIYIHGGVGGPGPHEQLADDWNLPPATTYSESCANIATGEWNHRMNLLYADTKFADIVEIEAYNGALSGISLDGTKYFYTNSLYADLNNRVSYRSGVRTRYLFCCPSKLPGFVAGISRWVYAKDDSGIYVNQFIGSSVTTNLEGKKVTIKQETDYPWDGTVKLTVIPERTVKFNLSIRIPGWVRSERLFPSDIYLFEDNKTEGWELCVNGEPVEEKILKKGYLQISRKWKQGDIVELKLPMLVRRIYSNPNIDATRGMVALMRGPVLYCLEGADNDFSVIETALTPDSEFDYEYDEDLLGGVIILRGNAVNSENEPVRFTAIPYYAWQNRGIHEMTVWLYQDFDQLYNYRKHNIENNHSSNKTVKELTGKL